MCETVGGVGDVRDGEGHAHLSLSLSLVEPAYLPPSLLPLPSASLSVAPSPRPLAFRTLFNAIQPRFRAVFRYCCSSESCQTVGEKVILFSLSSPVPVV